MPFYLDEPPEQSNWTETDTNSLAFILNKPALLKGEQGNDGDKGQKGEIGPRGIEGEKGDQGPDGEKGQKGEIGVGEKGEVGEKGIDGQKGQKGEIGISVTGEKGQKGEIGIDGEKGEKGEIGIDGEKGEKGEIGIQGEQGQKGAKGEIGNIGITGSKGMKGEQGFQGEKGIDGSKGPIGLTGDKGQKGEIHSSKFINNGSLNSSDEIEVVYDDGTNMTNKIDLSSLRELPTMLNTYYGKRLTVVQPSSGSGVEAQWHNQDTYSFTTSRTLAKLEVTKVEQNATSPYFNTTTVTPYNFLPVLVNDKVLSVTSGALNWVDFPADDNTRVTGFSIDASHNLSLSQNDATTPYSVNLAPYLDNKLPTTTDADKFAVSTTTADNWVLSDKISLNPARLGENTPTTIHNDSTLFGVYAGYGSSNSNILTCFGYRAGESSNIGNATTAIGYRAGDNSNGNTNTFVGFLAGNNVVGSQNFALGEGSMDGGTMTSCIGIGRYAFRGATAQRSIGFGINIMGSGYNFHTYATNSEQRSGNDKFLVGHNTSTASWTTTSPNTGNPYLLDGTMGSNDSVRSLKINANEFHLPTTLPFLQPTADTQIWKYFGFLVQGAIPANANFVPAVLGAHKFLLTNSLNAKTWSDTIGEGTTKKIQIDQAFPKIKLTNEDADQLNDPIGKFEFEGKGNIATGSDLMANGSFENYASSFVLPGSGYNPILPSTTSSASDTTTLTGWTASKPANANQNNVFIINNNNTAFGSQSQLGNHFIGFRGCSLTQNRTLTSTKQYILTWYEKSRTGASHTLTDLTVKVNNTVESATHPLTGAWVQNFCIFTASQASCDIEFIAKDIVGTPDLNTAFLDNVTLYETSLSNTIYNEIRSNIISSAPTLRSYISFRVCNDTPSNTEIMRIGSEINGTTTNNIVVEIDGKLKATSLTLSDSSILTTANTSHSNGLLTLNSTQTHQILPDYSSQSDKFLKVNTSNNLEWGTVFDSANVKNVLQSSATQNGIEVYNCFYHDTIRGLDLSLINTKLDSANVKNTAQTGALQTGTEVYNAWYHDTVRGIDALAKLDKSHVQSVYQATPDADDVYNCAHHDSAFKNTYGILYGNTQSSCYTTGYINQFYRESNNEKNITLVSSNTGQNDTLGSIQAWNGNTHISSAIAFLHSDEATVSGRINFYSYTNNNHATQGPSAYIQDDITNVKDLEAIGSISLNSVLTTSIISNTCLGNSKIINKSDTTTSTAVIGNFQSQAFVNITGNVQYPPALSANTSTVSGVTYTLTSSTNAFTGTQYDMYKAFDRNNTTGWHSLGNYNSSNNPTTMGQYQGSNSLGGISGEWIQLQMSSALPFGSVKIIGRQSYDPQASDSWELLASNNGSSWTSILQSTVHLTYNSGNGHTITINNTTSYTHYAIVAKTVAGPNSAYLTIHEIEFYTAVTTAYGEFTDLKTTKYGTDWGVLDINVRQNASLTPLVRLGKTQTSDPQDIMWNGKVQCTDTFTVSNLKIQGTGSNITFNNGLSQTQPLVDPTTTNYNNKAVLTAGGSGTWNWDVPPFVTKNNYVEVSSLSLLPTSYDASNPLRVWLDGAGSSTGSNISGVLRVGQVNTQYNSSTGQNNNVLQCANSNSSIFAFTHTSKARVQNNSHNLSISVNSNLEFVYLFDVKPTHAYYIITAQHENTYSVNSETDLNSYITNKTVNGFTLTFRQGDNGTLQDSPSYLVDHSVSIMGVSANQIDTTSQTIPVQGQTNVFPTGFNLA